MWQHDLLILESAPALSGFACRRKRIGELTGISICVLAALLGCVPASELGPYSAASTFTGAAWCLCFLDPLTSPAFPAARKADHFLVIVVVGRP